MWPGFPGNREVYYGKTVDWRGHDEIPQAVGGACQHDYERDTHKNMGDVYLVTPDEDEVYAEAIALGDSMGKRMVVDGFDDTPQIGGIKLCRHLATT